MIYLGLAGLAGFALAAYGLVNGSAELTMFGGALFVIGGVAFKIRAVAAEYAQQQFFLDSQRRK